VQNESGALQSSATSRKQYRLNRLDKKVRNEAWRVMVFVWQAVCASLIPVRLNQIPQALDRYLEHLSRSNKQSRKRQIPYFFEQLGGARAFG